jgi:pimeloyl-ACP methyl ester carboxylesterase
MSQQHRARSRRPWRLAAALSVAVLLAAALSATAASASSSTSPHANTVSPKPTIVFVHGAFADSSGWNSEIVTLTQLGYPVLAVSDELRGLTSDADYVRSVLRAITGPIVLVGHSYGGAVITNAARDVANVKALVYLGAYLPDQGESIATVLNPATYPGSLLGPDTTIARPAPNPAAPGGNDIDIYIDPADFHKVFAADVSTRTAAVMAATQRPLSLTAQTQASGPPAWKTIPSWDLITLNDKAIPPAGQQFMARRAKAHIETIASAHDVMVSHPADVVKIVLEAARQSA